MPPVMALYADCRLYSLLAICPILPLGLELAQELLSVQKFLRTSANRQLSYEASYDLSAPA